MAFVGAFLSLYVDLILRPYPGFQQSSRLATIGQDTGGSYIGLRYEIVERLAREMTSIEAAAVASPRPAFVGPEREETVMWAASREFFDGLRPRVALGRGLRVEDHAPDAEPVVVLSHRYWQRRFGGDRSVLGTFLEVTRNPILPYRVPFGWADPAEPEQETTQFRIVGVLDETFADFPAPQGVPSTEMPFWVPLERVYPLFFGVPESLPDTTASAVFVRRAPGVSAEALLNELRARYGGADSPLNLLPGARLDATDSIVSNFTVQREAKRQLEMFLAGSVLLALVAAANVSLFLLARAPGRRRELGIRLAVGAPLKRLARQLATEAGLLVVVSALTGLVLSIWLSAYLRDLTLLRDAEWRSVTLLDWRVLSLAGVFVLFLTLLISLAPIAGIKRIGIAASSRQATARASLAQRLAGTAQIAVAGAFGGAAIAFCWYIGGLMFGDPGYAMDDRYMVRLVDESRFEGPEGSVVGLARLRAAIEAIPGVTAVAFGNPVPGEAAYPSPMGTRYPGDPANTLDVYTGSLESRFVDLLGLKLIHGRVPDADESGFVVVVNQTLARALWGREDVVGERLTGDVRWGSNGSEIIGVLEDLPFGHPLAPVRPIAFRQLSASALSRAVIETQLTPAELRRALDRLVSVGELEIQVTDVLSLRTMRNDLIASDRARAFLTIMSAALVALLAAFGLYGTQRYLVAAGRREYAIRAALGAGPGMIGQLVVWRGLLLGLPGLAIGALLGFIVAAWLRDDFVSRDVLPAAVGTWVIAGLILLLVTASLSPAREARRTQPAPLLRED